MTNEQTRIIDKIRKLQAHAGNGRTTEEQAAFAAAVRRLMVEYHISEDDIHAGAEDYSAPAAMGEDVYNLHDYSEGTDFLLMLLGTIATAHMCSVALVGIRTNVYIIGTAIDRWTVRYMFDVLRTNCDRCAKAERRRLDKLGEKPERFVWLESFRTGYLRAIAARYAEERATDEAQVQQTRALVVTSRALARAEDYKTRRLGQPDSSHDIELRATDGSAYRAGVRAGEQQNLRSRGIAGQATAEKVLPRELKKIGGGA